MLRYLALIVFLSVLPARAQLLNEDFNDGVADGWQTWNPGWAVSGGIYHGTNTTPNIPVESYYAPGNLLPTWTDYVATVRFSFQGGYTPSDAQLIVRYQSPANNTRCQVVQYNGVQLFAASSGEFLLGSPVNVNVVQGQWYTIRATVVGSQFTCEIVELNAVISGPLPSMAPTGGVALRATHTPVDFDDVTVTAITRQSTMDTPFQARYFANLHVGDSVINLTNTGARGASVYAGTSASTVGSICANVYAFSPDEQLVACCSCPVTPNGLVSLSVRQDLIANTLTPAVPTAIVVKIYGSVPVGGSCASSSSGPGEATPGLLAWGTALHVGLTGSAAVTETSFSPGSLSEEERTRLTSSCTYINAIGSGFGICRSCRLGGLGAGRI